MITSVKYIFSALFVLYSITIAHSQRVRTPKDTSGFAIYGWQMDSVIKRLPAIKNPSNDTICFAICPHDDYTYASDLYNEIFSRIKAKTIIILGVAHKAKKYGIERIIVFDSYDKWKAPYGNITISPLRQMIIKNLPDSDYVIHDSLQTEEHSVEAFVPFIQYYNRDAEIISILIPHMPMKDMQKLSDDFTNVLYQVIKRQDLKWGKDVILLVSTDAVHYGDEDWGGSNYAPNGCDSAGYYKTIGYEKKIVDECFKRTTPAAAEAFFAYTVRENDWREYKWTWCGRYSVPFGLLTAFKLQLLTGRKTLTPVLSRYTTSIDHSPLKVDDIKMGATAPANLHHWVGYFAVGYK